MTKMQLLASQCVGIVYRTLKLNRFMGVPIAIFLGIECLLLKDGGDYNSSVVPNLNFTFMMTLQTIFIMNFVRDKSKGFLDMYQTMGLGKVPYVCFQFVAFMLFGVAMLGLFYLVYFIFVHRINGILPSKTHIFWFRTEKTGFSVFYINLAFFDIKC